MGKIRFTFREIKRAWRNNYQAYEEVKTETNNVHRLMLFYSVECGLKALIMKRENKNLTDSTITDFGHNINKMLDKLNSGNTLKLPRNIRLTSLQNNTQRNCFIEDLNQIWRYGHSFNSKLTNLENDQTLEQKLIEISKWIHRELSGI